MVDVGLIHLYSKRKLLAAQGYNYNGVHEKVEKYCTVTGLTNSRYEYVTTEPWKDGERG